MPPKQHQELNTNEDNHLKRQWDKPSRFIAAAILLISAFLVIAFFAPVYQILGLGFVFAFIFFKPIQSLGRNLPLRYPWVSLLFYILMGIFLALVLVAEIENLTSNANRFSDELGRSPEILESFKKTLPNQLIKSILKGAAISATTLSSLTGRIFEIIAIFVISMVFSFLLLVNLHQGRGKLAKYIPQRFHQEISLLLIKLDQVWVEYTLTQVIYAFILALAAWVMYSLLGVRYSFLMAVITGMLALVPAIGWILASFVVAFSCLLLGSSLFEGLSHRIFALLILLVVFGLTQAIYYIIAKPAVRNHPKPPVSLIVLGVLLGFVLGNFLMAIMVVPLLNSMTILGNYLIAKIMQREPFPTQKLPKDSQGGIFSQLIIPK